MAYKHMARLASLGHAWRCVAFNECPWWFINWDSPVVSMA